MLHISGYHQYYHHHHHRQHQQQPRRQCQEVENKEDVGQRGGGGVVAAPAIVVAARCAVMVAAALQKQMRYCFMPAVVENQLQKFETDPEIRQLVGPALIAFSGLPHAPPAERRTALLQNCTDRHPHLPIVSFESRFILNGVCVILRGALSRETMTGSSTLQFDEENAAAEEQRRQQAVQHYGDRIQAIRRRFNLPQS